MKLGTKVAVEARGNELYQDNGELIGTVVGTLPDGFVIETRGAQHLIENGRTVRKISNKEFEQRFHPFAIRKSQTVSVEKKQQKVQKTRPNRPAKTKTKKQLALEIFKKCHKRKTVKRKDVIAKFIEQLGMTPAGASTYYHLCKKEIEQ